MATGTETERQVVSRRVDGLRGWRPIQPFLRPLPISAGLRVLPSLIGVLGFVSSAANSQEGRGFSLQPSVDIRETLTSNVRMQSGNDARSDLITEVSPRVRLSSSSGRLKGSFDYSLRGLVYARESSSSEVQQALRAQGSYEAVDNWAFVDASASVSQQSTSAFGTRSSDNALIDSNRSEVLTYQLAPYVRGRLGGFANYEARWSWASTSSQSSKSDSTSQTTSLSLSSDSSTFARLGWSAAYSRQTSEFGSRGSRNNDSLNGTLFYSVSPELRLQASAGRESNDLTSQGNEQSSTWGWGANWRPTERTSLDVKRNHRFFGDSTNISFQHRMPRSVWTLSTSRDLNTSALSNGAGTPQTVFDLLFVQFASIAPDPVQRTALVDAFLRNNGLDRTTLANGGFLTSTASVQRNDRFSVALLGLRSTLLFSASRNQSRATDASAAEAGDLSNGNRLRSRSFSVNLSHRLTPTQGLSGDVSLTRTNGRAGDRSTELKSFTASWSNSLTQDVSLSLSARRSLFSSPTDPYNESAIVANLSVRF